MKRFYVTSNHNILVNPRCLSTSVAVAVLKTFHNDILESHKSCASEGYEFADFELKSLVPTTETPDKETVALVREPIDRFLSACALNNTDIAETIEALKTGEGWQSGHPMFEKQSYSYDKVFKFPEQVQEFCEYVGLPYPLPKLNESQNKKAKLTKEQTKFLKTYYADDIALYAKL